MNVTDRRQVLPAVLQEAVAVSGADAAVHLIDPPQDDALLLEQHHGLRATNWDIVALATGPPHACARAQQRGETLTVPDIVQDPALAHHPAGRALLDVGSHASHSEPMTSRR